MTSKITIALDAREMSDRPAGRGRYISSLLEAMEKNDKNIRYIWLCGEKVPNISWTRAENIVIPYTGFRWHYECWNRLRDNGFCDLFLATRSPIVPSLFGAKSIFIAYDMVASKATEHLEYINILIDRLFTPRAIKYSRKIIAISESTKKDLLKLYPGTADKVVVVPGAPASSFYKMTPDAKVLKSYGLPSKYILSVGTIEPRKNHLKLVKAYSRLSIDLRKKYPLVLSGKKGWHYEPLFKEINMLGLERDVLFTGYVPDEDLVHIYNAAALFIYPSFYEGFGLPVIEAMKCEVPVIASNTSSIPEVAGDAAILIDPYSDIEIYKTMERFLTESGLREKYSRRARERSASYSWEISANIMLGQFEEIILHPNSSN
jgi:glycosyltransferase involved in cell wall biosynthesis